MHTDEEIKSIITIKQLLEELERSIGSYSVDEIIHSLRKYLHEGSKDPTKIHPTDGVIREEPFGEISFGASWILLIAFAQKDSPKDSSLKTPSEEQFAAWSKTFMKIVHQLKDLAYCRRFLMDEVLKFPDKIKAWEIVDESLWKDIAPFIPTVCHNRIQNERVQSNFVRNSSVPIARSNKLTKLFIDGLSKELQKKLIEHIKNEFNGMSLEVLHMNLYLLSHIICKQEGVSSASEVDQYFQETPAKLIDTTDEKQLHQTVNEIKQLLNILSTTSDEISTKYSKIKDALFQQKTMLVNENPFWDTPIYQTVQNGEIVYNCPDLNFLNLRLETIVIRCVDKWRENLPEKEKNTAKNIGTSRELFLYERINYHKELFVEGGIVRLDEKMEAQRYLDFIPETHGLLLLADSIVETPENIVIIECKNSLGIWGAFDIDNRERYYNTLTRIKDALVQCNNTLKALKPEPRKLKPIFHFVLCNENVWIEASIVAYIFYLGQKHHNSKPRVNELDIYPGNFSINSFSEFETLLNTNTLDRFIDDCREKAAIMNRETTDEEAFNIIKESIAIQFSHELEITENSLKYYKNIVDIIENRVKSHKGTQTACAVDVNKERRTT